ncbi:MAG: DUF2194 domain-containing protein [Lachnospira sp.]
MNRMLTKRIFFTISSIMLLVLFIFQLSGMMRKRFNSYDINSYADNQGVKLTKNDVFVPALSENEVLTSEKDYIVYIGDISDETVGNTVYNWCGYTKKNVVSYKNINDYRIYLKHFPSAILIDSEYIDTTRDISNISTLSDYGIDIVFCTLPEYEDIKQSEWLQEILGIGELVSPSANITGFEIYNGFLSGGAVAYNPKTDEEKKFADYDTQIPWYITSSGTKTYMSAIVDTTEYGDIKKENVPSIIWRKSCDNSYIFCISGDYMTDISGIGLLSAVESQMSDINIYPVVNAEMAVISDFPAFAFENEAEIYEAYARDTSSLFRNVIWPDISNLSDNTGYKLSMLFTPQFNYSDEIQPSVREAEYFFRLFNEKKFEAGLSTTRNDSTDIGTKLKKDKEFYKGALGSYKFLSILCKKSELDNTLNEIKNSDTDIQTVVLDNNDYNSRKLFAYATDNILTINSVLDGAKFSYMNDFKKRCLRTALLYTTIEVDMSDIISVDDNDILWNKKSKEISKAMGTYSEGGKYINKCSVTETDLQIRKFLSLNYSWKHEDNTVTINIDGNRTDSAFMAVFHNKEITNADGADVTMLEEDRYLIKSDKDRIVLKLSDKK